MLNGPIRPRRVEVGADTLQTVNWPFSPRSEASTYLLVVMKRYLVLFAAATALMAPATASADPVIAPELTPISYQQFRARQDDGPRVSLSEVVRRLRASRQGQMLDAQATTRDGRAIYVIIWEYPGGRIGNIYVDQRTGAVLGES